jgi:hypothetical protein
MRLPFISRRQAEETLCLLVEVSRRALAEVDEQLCEERTALRKAELEIATQKRVIERLTDQLLDATGYQGEPLLPAARATLGIEDAKEES